MSLSQNHMRTNKHVSTWHNTWHIFDPRCHCVPSLTVAFLHSCFDVRSTLQCPNEAFIDAESAAMRCYYFPEGGPDDPDEDADAGSSLSRDSGDQHDYVDDGDEDGDLWSDAEGAEGSAEERRGRNTRGLLAARPNQRPDPGLPPRAQGGGAKERHTRHQVWEV